MTLSTIVVADQFVLLPTDPERMPLRTPALRQRDCANTVIGFLDNTKDNVAELFDDMIVQMATTHPAMRAVRCRKDRFSGPAELALIDRLALECDAVIVAAGSCGSCTALSVLDAVALEARGVPAVTICTSGFEEAAKAQARALGMPEHPILVIGHPLGTMPRTEIRRQAQSAWKQAISVLFAAERDRCE
jgi:hypothetical protein